MTFTVSSYSAAAAAYALLTLLLILGRSAGREGHWVLAAVGGSALWGAAIAASLLLAGGDQVRPPVTLVPDALRTLLWTWCLLVALPGRVRWDTVKGLLSLAALALTGFTVLIPFVDALPDNSNFTLLSLSIIGCLAAEQVLRNSAPEQKRALKPFIWTIGAILVYDLFVFSDAVLFDALDAKLWQPRGLLAALAVPLFLLAAKRHPDWTKTLFISREIVFYSATLTGVGVYLIAMAVGGFIIRERGGEWGAAIQVAYLIAALGVLTFVLSSARLKTQLRVFISKHFFRNRYDYREEWLRLTRALSDANKTLPLDERSLEALCAIVGSSGGQMWLDRSGRSIYEPFGSWQAPFPTGELTPQSSLVRFLQQTQWVVDTRQYEEDPEHYQHAFRDEPAVVPRNSLIFPLIHQNAMLGIVRLECSEDLRALNYEDHDLLKTAGRQVAAFLAHDLAMEQLTATRQFEAYNKLSAFVMHDLKNLLAQQALLVDNARRFRDRPEFMADVISTVDNGVQRMRRLLRQLEQGSRVTQDQRVEINKLLLRAVSACSDAGKAPCTFTDSATFFWVRAHPDQLTSVISHLITNAQEATTNGGAVEIKLSEASDGKALVEIRDNGQGMSEEFIRRRLFRPFDSTKGSSGMGIGAYQAREIVRGLGGEMTVVSELGKGTVVTLALPLARPSGPHESVSSGP